MPKRIAHKEEPIRGTENSRKYEEAHRGPAKIIFGALQKEIKALMPSGDYLEVGAGPGILSAIIAEDNPGVHITAVDISPDMADASKRRLCDLLAEKKTWVLAQHFHPFPSLGHIVKKGKAWQWQPVQL